MTAYQIYTRLKHNFGARHWRGHGVHSPMMYAFIRTVVMKTPREKLIEAITIRYGAAGNVVIVDSMAGLKNASKGTDVVLFDDPFRTAEEHRQFKEWYDNNDVVVAHLQGLLVVFFDAKLTKQIYCIRS